MGADRSRPALGPPWWPGAPAGNNWLGGNEFLMGNFYRWKGLERVCRQVGKIAQGIELKKAGEWPAFIIWAGNFEWFCRWNFMVQQWESCNQAPWMG